MTFDEFAGARLQAVLRFATALTGDPDLAKDLVQEVLIRVSGRWQQIGELDRPEAYIRKMVVNEYLSWRHRCRDRHPRELPPHLVRNARTRLLVNADICGGRHPQGLRLAACPVFIGC